MSKTLIPIQRGSETIELIINLSFSDGNSRNRRHRDRIERLLERFGMVNIGRSTWHGRLTPDAPESIAKEMVGLAGINSTADRLKACSFFVISSGWFTLPEEAFELGYDVPLAKPLELPKAA